MMTNDCVVKSLCNSLVFQYRDILKLRDCFHDQHHPEPSTFGCVRGAGSPPRAKLQILFTSSLNIKIGKQSKFVETQIYGPLPFQQPLNFSLFLTNLGRPSWRGWWPQKGGQHASSSKSACSFWFSVSACPALRPCDCRWGLLPEFTCEATVHFCTTVALSYLTFASV